MLRQLWVVVLANLAVSIATPLIWDGRAPFSLNGDDLNDSLGPYLTAVKGKAQNATHYTKLHGHSLSPTPLWNKLLLFPSEQVVSVSIDNTSVFVPGGSSPQLGFRRTELIAAANGNHNDLNPLMEQGTTAFHFSIKKDEKRPLSYKHEYQIVFIEPSDGTHVFGIQLGSPFTNPTGPLPAPNAHSLKVLDHALNVLFAAPFESDDWHNFAIQVDWTQRTLAVFYSKEGQLLKPVTKVLPNASANTGSTGQGDFHFGVLKLPLVNPADTPADQGDVVHFGIQEGTTEALFYSGVFVEKVTRGVSIGNGLTRPALS